MKLFSLNRTTDVTGVSGTGIVAQGVEFDNGKVVVTWLGEFATVTTHDNIDSVKAIHCHNGLTEIQWLDVSNEACKELETKLTQANEKLALAYEIYGDIDKFYTKFQNRWWPLIEDMKELRWGNE